MTTKNIVKNLRALLKNKGTFLNIYSTKDFHAILKRERSRSDRTNHKFSLIVFDIGASDKDMTLARYLVDKINSRVRVADYVGWFDKGKIAVLLPDTSSQGAWMLADMIRTEIKVSPSALTFTVYSYPSQKRLAGNRHPESSLFTEDKVINVANE